jgi:hypothetical protein
MIHGIIWWIIVGLIAGWRGGYGAGWYGWGYPGWGWGYPGRHYRWGWGVTIGFGWGWVWASYGYPYTYGYPYYCYPFYYPSYPYCGPYNCAQQTPGRYNDTIGNPTDNSERRNYSDPTPDNSPHARRDNDFGCRFVALS